MSTVDDAIEAGARALAEAWTDENEYGSQQDMSRVAARAQWPILSRDCGGCIQLNGSAGTPATRILRWAARSAPRSAPPVTGPCRAQLSVSLTGSTRSWGCEGPGQATDSDPVQRAGTRKSLTSCQAID